MVTLWETYPIPRDDMKRMCYNLFIKAARFRV